MILYEVLGFEVIKELNVIIWTGTRITGRFALGLRIKTEEL